MVAPERGSDPCSSDATLRSVRGIGARTPWTLVRAGSTRKWIHFHTIPGRLAATFHVRCAWRLRGDRSEGTPVQRAYALQRFPRLPGRTRPVRPLWEADRGHDSGTCGSGSSSADAGPRVSGADEELSVR